MHDPARYSYVLCGSDVMVGLQAARIALSGTRGISSVEEALAGARDIFAEEIAESQEVRLRQRAQHCMYLRSVRRSRRAEAAARLAH